MIGFRLTSLVLIASLPLAACTHYEPVSLHGAGSMRVEVEVYKGPVTLSPDAQIAQTVGVMGDLVRAMDKWHDEVAQTLGIDVYEAQPRIEPVLPVLPKEPDYRERLTPEQKQQWEADKRAYADRIDAYKRARAAYDRQWSEHQLRLQHALRVDNGGARYCAAYRQTSGGSKLSIDDWRDCDALLTAYENSERVIANACYIMHTPPFEAIAPKVYIPENTCEKSGYKAGWAYLYESVERTKVDGSLLPESAASTKSDASKYTEVGRAAGEELSQIYYDRLNREWETCKGSHNNVAEGFAKCDGQIVLAMESFTTMLRSTAFRVADANIRYVPHDRNFRGLLVTYSYIASQYGDQMSSRVAVLQKELTAGDKFGVTEGRDIRSLLPAGDYLRGAGYSDFVHLYDWLQAADGNQPGKLDIQARARMAERLSDNYYWEKVNEVYASGQGDVSMAFVKDAIGNWSLKSFTNDPSKLLAAYRKVADAGLNTAAKLTARAVSGGAVDAISSLNAAERAAAFAQQVAGGETAPSNVPDLTGMRTRLVARIKARQAVYESRESPILADLSDDQKQIKLLEDEIQSGGDSAALQPKLDIATAKQKSDQDRLLGVLKDAIQGFGDVLDDQSQVLVTMQEAVAPKEDATPAK